MRALQRADGWAARRMKLPPWAVLVAVLASLLVVQSCRIDRWRREAAANALRADSVEAFADRSRTLSAVALALLADSAAGAERRVVQQRQRGDQLDRALGRERIARLAAEVRVHALDSSIASLGAVRGDTGVRVAEFAVRDEPYTIQATATLPPAPRPGALRVRVTLDSVLLGLRLGCGSANGQGIRPATATILGPPWAAVALGAVEQSPDLCRSPALQPRRPSRLRWAGLGVAVGVVLGVLFH